MEGRDSERPGLEGAIRTIASGRATPLGAHSIPGVERCGPRLAGAQGPAPARNGSAELACLGSPLPDTVLVWVPDASDG